MDVLLFLLGYCLGGWIVMLIMGWLDEDNTYDANLIWTAGLMWPLFLVFISVWKTLELLIALGDRFPWIGKVFYCIGMVFRPYSLGQNIYEFVKRKGKTDEKNNTEQSVTVMHHLRDNRWIHRFVFSSSAIVLHHDMVSVSCWGQFLSGET